MKDPNPYAISSGNVPRVGFANGGQLAAKYEADYSRLGLSEYRRVSGAPVRGTLHWLSMRLGLAQPPRQVFEAPKPWLSDLCSMDAVPEQFQSDLAAIQAEAEKLGFTGEACTVKRSQGVEITTVGIRMLHASGESFLTAMIAHGHLMVATEQQITSVFNLGKDFTAFSVTNEALRFSPSPRCQAIYRVGATLMELFSLHNEAVVKLPEIPSAIPKLEDIAIVVDTLMIEFYQRMCDTGVLAPVK